MSKITLAPNASGTGTLTVAAPNTNSDYTLTLPAETGTVLTSASTVTQNSGPAFSVWASGTPSISSNTWTKIPLDTEVFDTNSNFDPTTNYRFTPTVAGYYQINGRAGISGTSGVTTAFCAIYKNGSRYRRGSDSGSRGTTNVSDVVYCNGSTDYVELYIYQFDGGGVTLDGGEAQRVYFSGAMVRAA